MLLTCVVDMQFVDNSFVASPEDDHQILDGDGPVAVTRPRGGPRRIRHFLPLQHVILTSSHSLFIKISTGVFGINSPKSQKKCFYLPKRKMSVDVLLAPQTAKEKHHRNSPRRAHQAFTRTKKTGEVNFSPCNTSTDYD